MPRRNLGEDLVDYQKANDKLLVNDMISDNFVHQSVMNPTRFSVVSATNLTGDLFSDLYAGIIGGLGVAPEPKSIMMRDTQYSRRRMDGTRYCRVRTLQILVH